MAVILGWIVLGSLLGLAVMQSIYVWLHCRFVASSLEVEQAYQPEVAVLLCLRGRDPSLGDCLQGLVSQNYDSFSIHVIVDHEQDLALQDAKNFFEANGWEKFRVHVLKDHSKHCSLKCSAIVTAVLEIDESTLEEEVEVIALIDADAVADKNWLSDLVGPLSKPDVGASTGNRWFAPKISNLGSEVRKAWNAAAVAQMTFYKIPWGGSLALKCSTINDCDLLEKWSHAFCEDTMLTNVLKSNELRIERIPNLILSNDESTSLSGTFHWIVRQMLTVRLHHRDWPLVLLHGLFSGAVLLAAVFSIAILIVAGVNGLAAGLLAGLVLFEVINFGLITAIENANVAAIASRGIAVSKTSLLSRMLTIPITQVLHPIAVLKAALTKKVSWRGIEYMIGRKKTIEMIEYQPFDASNDTSNSIG